MLHHAAAWGTVLCALAPLLHGWTVPAGAREWPVRIWPGHLLIDAVEVVAFVLAGLVGGGWWWWAAGWRRGSVGAAGATGLMLAGIGAAGGWLSPRLTVGVLTVWLLWAVVAVVFFPVRRVSGMKKFLRERHPWNAVFFVSFVLLNTVSDVLLTDTAPPGWLAATGFMAGRFFTQLVVAAGLWLLLALVARWSPRGAGWVGWVAVLFVPLLVAVDMALRLMWTKSLMHLCAEIENDGKVDILKIVEAGGVDAAAGQVVVIIACILAAPAWYLACRWLSQRGQFRTNALRFAGMALTSWVFLMALQVVESACKSEAWRQWESRASMLHLTPFSPPPGLVTFRVAPLDAAFAPPVAVAEKPDIYFFIVETMRADSIHPERTPFLAKWKAEECQVLSETRAASNATHLSWFSILHGRLPWFHESVRRKVEPAPLLALLHEAGYRIEVRSGGNFDYCDMLASNFGDGGITAVMEHAPEGHPDRALPMAERERRLMERLRESVVKSPPGGVLRLATIDTPHYPYKWHEQWTPPYADYEKEPAFPIRPSPEEVVSVQHRYWNSISWCDHLVGEFVTWLKSTGRYDASMIILTGDHGEEFKENGSWFHCSALNHAQTRVPMLIKWPAATGRGPAHSDASHLDLVPSILDAVGLPKSVWQAMPGRSLRRDAPATSIVATCYNSQDGEAMVWRRDGWEAAFSWASPWVLAPPEKVWLERLEGPEGRVECADPAEYEAELRRRFPDAFGRVFQECERQEN